MLWSAFGQVLDFPLDIAELTHVHFIIFPTKIAVRKALPSENSSKFCNINRKSSYDILIIYRKPPGSSLLNSVKIFSK